MRIALFTDAFYPQINGVSNTLSYLSRYLSAKNVGHRFFAPDYGFETPECGGLPVERFRGIRPAIYPECRLAFAPLKKMTELLEEYDPDVVHIVTEATLGLAGLRAASAMGLPIVMSYHTNFDQYLRFYHLTHLSQPLWAYMKWFHSFALVNLCPSRDTLRSMERRGFGRLGIWSRGIDLTRFGPSHFSPALRRKLGAGDRTVFLYVGRVSAEKGLDVLARSIRAVNEAHPGRAQFWITGDGPYRREMEALSLPNVVFTGEKRGLELSQIYASADAFVFPSGTETFGNALLEAMASGLPPVCTDSGGVTDYTADGENALVCRYGDPESLARAVAALLDPALRARIREGALRTARSRSWESVFDTLMRHYRAALRRPADLHAR